jgi:hypothetical protein
MVERQPGKRSRGSYDIVRSNDHVVAVCPEPRLGQDKSKVGIRPGPSTAQVMRRDKVEPLRRSGDGAMRPVVGIKFFLRLTLIVQSVGG